MMKRGSKQVAPPGKYNFVLFLQTDYAAGVIACRDKINFLPLLVLLPPTFASIPASVKAQ